MTHDDALIEALARAIWNLRREEEDRCDMELEDMGDDHSVWVEARAVLPFIADARRKGMEDMRERAAKAAEETFAYGLPFGEDETIASAIRSLPLDHIPDAGKKVPALPLSADEKEVRG